MKFLFIPQGCLTFHANSLEETPLGGIETGVIRLSTALSKLGHEVIVLSALENPPVSDPLYVPFKALGDIGTVDVLIAVRDITSLLLPLNCSVRYYWTGDSYDQPLNIGLGDKRYIERCDGLLAVSEWQKTRICEESGFPRSKAFVIKNGVHLEYFKRSSPRTRKRLIYSSTPYRGLKFVPELYKKILLRHPDAELHVFSGYDVYGGEKNFPEEVKREFLQIKSELEQCANCFLHGNVTQEKLAEEFLKSAILFYPNIFEETSCITVLEAQAAGVIPVTSTFGALVETVGEAGFCIEGEPGSERFNDSFIKTVDNLLADDQLFESYSLKSLAKARDYDWSIVAGNFLRAINQCSRIY
jgi:glycosyltransferase involved in cell wall biosynthesis